MDKYLKKHEKELAMDKYLKKHEKELATQTSLTLNKKLVGGIPSSLASYTHLTEIDISDNQLKGKIPPSLKALTNLTSLNLQNNKLAGKCPDIFECVKNITKLNLSGNKLNGLLPSSIGNLNDLTELYIHNNKFNGPLPESFENLSNLTHLELDICIFSQGIPSYFEKLKNLKKLRVHKAESDKTELNINGLIYLQTNNILEIVTIESDKKDIPSNDKGAKENKSKSKDEKIEIQSTVPGEKKDTSVSFPSSYHPKYVESAWYAWWEKQGFFSPEYNKDAEESFVIVIPPPNVTGYLHLGHALANSVEDAIVRWNRMNGKKTLWVPGIDHAGIATQAVVEKRLWVEEKKRKVDFTREQFLSKVWDWKNQYGQRITNQLRRLGSSLDWTREAFTMDEKLSKAVVEAFVRLFEKGKIERRERLVNWCCTLHTAISDIEVDPVELGGPTFLNIPGYTKQVKFGCIWEFAYKVEGSNEEIIVATTRPETMLGDTAVAVHPDDPKYKHLHGKRLVHPFLDRKIPIITDNILVDMNFGTGAVKITPSHDPNDFECGKRHNLEFITIFNIDGTVNDRGGKFSGMKRFDARKAVIDELEELGLYKGEKSNPMRLSTCSRSNDIIEPLLLPQWYVKCGEMAEKALEVVKNGELSIIPPSFTSTWYSWLENIQDWCVSRQLWWGHRIPAYLVHFNGKPSSDGLNMDLWVVANSEELARKKAEEKFKTKEFTLEQDPDVLDTWFSSGLFPFSVMGWPDETLDLENFYPNSVLETGHDILFFWVARMVMLGLELTGKLPFKLVYLHAMVRDGHGRKMSKALGNVIDPIDVIEGIDQKGLIEKLHIGNLAKSEISVATIGIKKDFPKGIIECGTDALRFTLCAYTSQERAINLDIQRIFGYRKFCNKIWNAAKLALKILGDYKPKALSGLTGKESDFDKFILSRLNHAIKESNEGFKEYNFSKATTAIFSFWLYELCDYYLEAVKYYFPSEEEKSSDEVTSGSDVKAIKSSILESIEKKKKIVTIDLDSIKETIFTCLDQGLKLLHPFMPFITEELWQRINKRESEASIPSICVAQYPVEIEERNNQEVENTFENVKKVINTARKLSSKGKFVTVYVKNREFCQDLFYYHDIICILIFSRRLLLVGIDFDLDGDFHLKIED